MNLNEYPTPRTMHFFGEGTPDVQDAINFCAQLERENAALREALPKAFKEGYSEGYNNGESDCAAYERGSGGRSETVKLKEREDAWEQSDARAVLNAIKP